MLALGNQSLSDSNKKSLGNQEAEKILINNCENEFSMLVDETFFKHSQNLLFETGRFMRMFTDRKPLGSGGFGRVFEALHNIEQTKYAIKQVFLPLRRDQNIQDHKYFREVNSLTKFTHKNVIR
jgi:serine/threonine protein kinase